MKRGQHRLLFLTGKILGLLSILFVLFFSISSQAQRPGDVDLSFDPGSGVDGTVYSVVLLADGKILIGGNFMTVRGLVRNGIARLNADGTGDSAFDPGSGANGGIYTEVYSVAVQTDGKVLIVGEFTSVNGVGRNRIARLNSDGSLDTSFDPGSGADTTVYSVVVQTDGKVIIAGDFNLINGVSRTRIARLNSDGSLDTSFDPGSGANDWVYSVAVQTNGKVVIGGDFNLINGVSRNRIARLNSDGSLDTSFDPGSGANDWVYSVAVQPDGKLLIGGDFITVNGVIRIRIARLNSDGSVDTSFNPGMGPNYAVFSVVMQPDGKVVIGGWFNSVKEVYIRGIARLNSDGSLDTSFDPGSGASGYVYSAAVQTDGKVVIGGSFSFVNDVSRNYIARLNSDGTLDSGFDPSPGMDGYVRSVAVQTNGKVFIAGNFTSVNGVSRTRIARLNSDGILDTSFDPGSSANNSIYSAAVQTDGKVVIGGNFTSVNGVSRTNIARLNSDGSLDTSFDTGSGANSYVYSVVVQTDGKVIIGGWFGSVNGVSRNRIARLNSDGSVDTSFHGSVASSYVYSVAMQSNGKVIIGGAFSSVSGVSRNRIARLNSDGSLDTGFNPGLGANTNVNSVAVQTDGKVVIGGYFTSVNGVNRNRIARLNSDGSLDTSFDPGSGANTIVWSVAAQTDGKVVAVGNFTSANGVSRNGIARLNSNGSLDTSFDPGSGVGINLNLGVAAYINAVAVQTDGKVLIGGWFTSVNGIPRGYVARLWGGSPLTLSPAVVSNQLQLTVNTQPGIPYTLQASTKLVDWDAVTNFIPTNIAFQVFDVLTDPQRFYRVRLQP